jgi:NADH dehydrogenase
MLLSFVVVGGGHSGVETAGQMIDLIRGVCRFYDYVQPEEPSVTLIHSRERLLPTLDEKLSDYTRRKLERNGVKVLLNRKVRATTARSVLLDDGTRLEAVTVVCTVGNAPHPLVAGLARHGALPAEGGKIIVSASGKVMGCDHLWAAGDCALFPKAGGGFCPETAQFAMRQGAHVAENIAASYFGHPLEPFTFTGQGELAVIGHRSAVASVMGVNFSGFPAWFFWRTLYLLKLPGLDRKLRVVAEWTLDLFFPRDINLLTPRYSSPLEEMHLEPGDPLFHAGEPAFSFYAVKSGRVDIVDRDGQVVKSAGRGDHFGERALLEDRVWHFDAIAREQTELVAIEARTFDKMVGCMEVLERLFTRSARQYAMPEEVDRAVARLPEGVRSARASEIMTRDVATLPADASISAALDLFQARQHSLYPVLDASGRVLGALRRKALYDWLAQHDLEKNHTLREVPLSPLLRVKPDTTAAEILEDLIRNGATKAAVTSEGGTLAGIVSLYDLVRR